MKQLFFIVAVAVLSYGCASAPKGENCTDRPPPKEAYPTFDPEAKNFRFTYPKVLPANYTGCQTTWDETGKFKYVIHFENGKPDALNVSVAGNSQLAMSCQIIENEEPAVTRGRGCLSFEAAQSTVKEHQEAEPFKGEIPPNRDPRR